MLGYQLGMRRWYQWGGRPRSDKVIKRRTAVNMLKPWNNSLIEQDSLVQPNEKGCFKILVENHGFDSVYLDQEQIIGAL